MLLGLESTDLVSKNFVTFIIFSAKNLFNSRGKSEITHKSIYPIYCFHLKEDNP